MPVAGSGKEEYERWTVLLPRFLCKGCGHTHVGFPEEAYLGRNLLCVFEDEDVVRSMEPDMEKVLKLPGLLFHVTAPCKTWGFRLCLTFVRTKAGSGGGPCLWFQPLSYHPLLGGKVRQGHYNGLSGIAKGRCTVLPRRRAQGENERQGSPLR